MDEKKKSYIYTAVLTPQHEDLSINFTKFYNQCQKLLSDGCSGLVILGTTGEANSFSVQERLDLLDKIGNSSLPKDKLIIGTGCCSLTETVVLTQRATELGIYSVLVLPPFYYKDISEDGLFTYFDHFINKIGNSKLKIILYNFPRMTGINFSTTLLSRLINSFPDNVTGIKDSSNNLENIKQMCATLENFQVYASRENLILEVMESGGTGCISASLNVTSKLLPEFLKEKSSNNLAKLSEIRNVIEKYSFIPALKQIMATIENDPSWLFMRPPVTKMKKKEAAELLQELKLKEFF
jgi:4-hydroxy-tetrahydrodipicolinate synthase